MSETNRKLLKLYFGYGVLLYIQFFIVYGGANWIASESKQLYHLYFEWETDIAFVPVFIVPYLSLSLFIVLPVFFIDAGKIIPWAKTYMLMVFAAGLMFLLLPTEHAVTRPEYVGVFVYFFDILYALDLPYNLFPSLHVALSTLALLIMLPLIANRWLLTSIGLWWLLMTASVILVRQHHMLDIAGGIILAWLCYRFFYRKAIAQS